MSVACSPCCDSAIPASFGPGLLERWRLSWSSLCVVASLLAAIEGRAEDFPRSGFLHPDVYAQLRPIDENSDLLRLRWLSARFHLGRYRALLIDPLVLFPKPEPGPQVSADTLDAIADYATRSLKTSFAEHVALSEEPGEGVLRVLIALTSVSIETESMQAYELIPIAAIFGAAQAISGRRDREVRVFLEVKMHDSVSGEYVGAAMREIRGRNLGSSSEQLTLEHLRDDIDELSASSAPLFADMLQ